MYTKCSSSGISFPFSELYWMILQWLPYQYWSTTGAWSNDSHLRPYWMSSSSHAPSNHWRTSLSSRRVWNSSAFSQGTRPKHPHQRKGWDWQFRCLSVGCKMNTTYQVLAKVAKPPNLYIKNILTCNFPITINKIILQKHGTMYTYQGNQFPTYSNIPSTHWPWTEPSIQAIDATIGIKIGMCK